MDGSSQAPSGMSPLQAESGHTEGGTLSCLARKLCFSGDFPFPWAEILSQRSSRLFCLSSLSVSACLPLFVINVRWLSPSLHLPCCSLMSTMYRSTKTIKYLLWNQSHVPKHFRIQNFFFLLLPFLTFVTRHQYPRFCVICQYTIYFDKNIQPHLTISRPSLCSIAHLWQHWRILFGTGCCWSRGLSALGKSCWPWQDRGPHLFMGNRNKKALKEFFPPWQQSSLSWGTDLFCAVEKATTGEFNRKPCSRQKEPFVEKYTLRRGEASSYFTALLQCSE